MGRKWNHIILAAFAVIGVSIVSSTSFAHEFWIEPESHTVKAGELIRADLKVGQNYSGGILPYLSHRFLSYNITQAGATRPNKRNEGDSPSVRIEQSGRGLVILTYHSTADGLDYDEWQTFREYAEYEGHQWAIAAHLKARLPRTGFSEFYTRCAKALVQVGKPMAGDRDMPTGMPLELVALENPFDKNRTSIPVILLRDGNPVPDVQIAIFRKGPAVDRQIVRTGQFGRATISLIGGGDFLLNAVDLKRAPGESEAAWISEWASLTFSAPGR